MDYKEVNDLSVKELKRELAAYGVDFSACVEKADMRTLLAKTRKAQGWPPPADAQSAQSAQSASSKAASSRASSSGSQSSGSSRAASGQKAQSAKARLAKLRVAVLFDPDNDDVRDCAQFIQPFFMNSPECTSGEHGVAVSWVMPASLRAELVRLNLPEQLANFAWFQALFVEADGSVIDFDGNDVDDGALADGDDDRVDGEPLINRYARIAQRWRASWLVLRREGGVVGRLWLTSMATALTAGFMAAYVPGILVVDAAWHAEQAGTPLVPTTLSPSGSWYYWLLELYDGLTYKLNSPDEPDADADKVMLACDDDQLEPLRTEKFAPHKRK